MKPFHTEAIVLRRTNYGEADRILTLLTPHNGKLSAIAKGVRKPKSKLAGGLELLAVCDVTVMQGRGLALVTSARLRTFYREILTDYDRTQLAYACIKHINTATETVAEPEFFYLLRDALQYTSTPYVDWRYTDLWFRLQLLGLLGRGLNVASDVTSKPLQPDVRYDFDFAQDAFYIHKNGRFAANHIKLLRLASAKTPVVLQNVSGTEGTIGDVLWLVHRITL